MNIGFIGFGEAAYCIALGFSQNGTTGIRANDAMMNHPVMGQQVHARAAEAQVELVEDAKEVARWADVLFAAVPSSFTMSCLASPSGFPWWRSVSRTPSPRS